MSAVHYLPLPRVTVLEGLYRGQAGIIGGWTPSRQRCVVVLPPYQIVWTARSNLELQPHRVSMEQWLLEQRS
jgi:hypothetical protein